MSSQTSPQVEIAELYLNPNRVTLVKAVLSLENIHAESGAARTARAERRDSEAHRGPHGDF